MEIELRTVIPYDEKYDFIKKLITNFSFWGTKNIGLHGRAAIDVFLIFTLISTDIWLLQAKELKSISALIYLVVILIGISAYLRVKKNRINIIQSRPGWFNAAGIVILANGFEIILLLLFAWLIGAIEPEFSWAILGKPKENVFRWLLTKFFTVFVQQLGLQLVLYPLCVHITKKIWCSDFGCCCI
jgi:hypothetical protein